MAPLDPAPEGLASQDAVFLTWQVSAQPGVVRNQLGLAVLGPVPLPSSCWTAHQRG